MSLPVRASENAATAPSTDLGLGARVVLNDVTKYYGDVGAVSGVSLDIPPGEILTILGSSGSGKTTTLLIVAGFHAPSSGNVWIDGRDITYLPPERRNVGIVFQHYALFPHMSVAENIAFPLRMRGLRSLDIRSKVTAALELVRMSGFDTRYPSQLSGGQQQRVALARATVFQPPVLLLDEPLGALDKKLRDSMQLELKEMQSKTGITMIYVTHDQTEALSLSDRIAVMHDGCIEQIGTPSDLYERPATLFVADFVGDSNFISGVVTSRRSDECLISTPDHLSCVAIVSNSVHVGSAVEILVRPERIVVGECAESLSNSFLGTVEDVSYVGDAIKYRVALSERTVVTGKVSNTGHSARELEKGTSSRVGWRAEDAIIFPNKPSPNVGATKVRRANP